MIETTGLTHDQLRKEEDLAVRITQQYLTETAAEPSTAALVQHLQTEDRLLSAIQSRRYRIIGEIANAMGDSELVAAEIGAALHLTRAASRSEVDFADALGRHPQVLEMLRVGDIDIRRARVLVDGVRGLSPEIADRALDQVGPDAPRLTTGQLRARLSRTCAELDPQTTQDRYEAGVEQRRFVLSATPEMTAHLSGYDLPPEWAQQTGHGPTGIGLLASSLSGAAIVWGKALGAMRRLMWPMIAIVAHFMLFTVGGVISPPATTSGGRQRTQRWSIALLAWAASAGRGSCTCGS